MKHFKIVAVSAVFFWSLTAVSIATQPENPGKDPSGGHEATQQEKTKDFEKQDRPRGETSLKQEGSKQQSEGQKSSDPLEKEHDRGPGIGPSSEVGAGQ